MTLFKTLTILSYGLDSSHINNTNLAPSATTEPVDSWKHLTYFPYFQDSPRDSS